MWGAGRFHLKFAVRLEKRRFHRVSVASLRASGLCCSFAGCSFFFSVLVCHRCCLVSCVLLLTSSCLEARSNLCLKRSWSPRKRCRNSRCRRRSAVAGSLSQDRFCFQIGHFCSFSLFWGAPSTRSSSRSACAKRTVQQRASSWNQSWNVVIAGPTPSPKPAVFPVYMFRAIGLNLL